MKTLTPSSNHRNLSKSLVYLLVVVMLLILAAPGLASGGEVTRGEFHTFASGPGLGYDVSGHARMTRTADGKTIVSTHAAGLLPNTGYGVHVHNQSCSDNNGGGHYQEVVGGPVDAYNEIWPLFTTDAEGVGNGKAVHAFTARPEAQAVVIHAPGGARIACADLQ